MIDFDVEWQEAPGVGDAVLARTWCRLTIRVNGQFVTRVMDRRTNGWRNAVFGAKDLLDAATAQGVAQDVKWIEEARLTAGRAKRGKADPKPSGPWPVSVEQTAYRTGYMHAVALRDTIGTPSAPIADLAGLMRRMGWARSPIVALNGRPASPLLDAVVDYGAEGAPVVASHLRERESSERFRLARSLFMQHQSNVGERRLVTESHTWDQRASRAFAAELLAPAEALSTRIGSTHVLGHDVERLAGEFNVSPMVIEHQIDNHDIATVKRLAVQ